MDYAISVRLGASGNYGALFKILSWPYANQMLIAGMGTEALIFLCLLLKTLQSSISGRGHTREYLMLKKLTKISQYLYGNLIKCLKVLTLTIR